MGVRAHNGGMLLGAQAVEVLLRAGADLNCTDNGETSPLFFAASGGHVEVPLPDQTSTLAGRLRVPHPLCAVADGECLCECTACGDGCGKGTFMNSEIIGITFSSSSRCWLPSLDFIPGK